MTLTIPPLLGPLMFRHDRVTTSGVAQIDVVLNILAG